MNVPQAVTPADRRLGRSVVAVAGGFLAVLVLSTAVDAVMHLTGVYPAAEVRMADGLFVFALAYRFVITVFGGWLTARLAPSRPMRHVAILCGVGSLGGLAGVGVALSHPELGPLWYSVLLMLTAIAATLGGGWLRTRKD